MLTWLKALLDGALDPWSCFLSSSQKILPAKVFILTDPDFSNSLFSLIFFGTFNPRTVYFCKISH